MDDCIIYDFETLGNQYTGVAVSLAILRFNESNYALDPYNYDNLVEDTAFIKFDVEEQVKRLKIYRDNNEDSSSSDSSDSS